MPELPEVETVRRELEERVSGRKIEKIIVNALFRFMVNTSSPATRAPLVARITASPVNNGASLSLSSIAAIESVLEQAMFMATSSAIALEAARATVAATARFLIILIVPLRC